MRLLISGGTGFIGSHLINLALAEGHQVVAIRRQGSKARIALVRQPEWFDCSMDKVPRQAFDDCDALVHLAAHGVSPQATSWDQAIEVNVRQSSLLVANALEAGIGRIVICGSCLEYGLSAERYDAVPSTAPLEPVGPYATSKAIFSQVIASMARTHDADYHIVRPFNLYGEGQHPTNFWPSLRDAALSGADYSMTHGEQVRDFLPVESAARKFLASALLTDKVLGQLRIENLGSGVATSLLEFARKSWSDWNASGELKPGDLPYRKNEVMRLVPEL